MASPHRPGECIATLARATTPRNVRAVFHTFREWRTPKPRCDAGRAYAQRAKKPLLALEIGVNKLGHFLGRQSAGVLRSVDEKSGRRLDLEFVHGTFPDAFDA